MIPEIAKFRDKYPMYNDMDDLTLANRISNKYPVYNDLPGKVAMEANQKNPAMQGGATSPINIQDQQTLAKAQENNNNLDPSVAAIGAAYNASWPVSALAMRAMGNKALPGTFGTIDNIPSATTSGGALLQDLGVVVNPLTQGAVNLGLKGIGALSGSLGNAGKRIVNSFQGTSSSDLKAQLAQRKVEIQQSVNVLQDLFKQKSANVVSTAKNIIPQISRGMSDAYGQGLENIFTKLEQPIEESGILKKNAPPITNQEVVGQLQSLVDRAANDPLIVKSDAYTKTVKMLDYYKNGVSSESGLLDASGNVIKSDAPTAVDLKGLIAQTRDIRGTIKAATSNGSAPVTAQDYFATQFDKAIGGLLKDRVNGFSELQKSYAPMANTRKIAYKLFKPLSDEDSATAFLNRVKNDNMKSSDYQLVKFLQSGGNVAGKQILGMGDFSTGLMDIGKQLKTLKSGDEIRQIGANIAQKAANEEFRNRFFLWAAGLAGLGEGARRGAHLLSNPH